jgi:hypothetical protein
LWEVYVTDHFHEEITQQLLRVKFVQISESSMLQLKIDGGGIAHSLIHQIIPSP